MPVLPETATSWTISESGSSLREPWNDIGRFHDSSPCRMSSTGASAGRASPDGRVKNRERAGGRDEARAARCGDEAVGESGSRGVGGVEGEAPPEESAHHAAHLLLLGVA